MAKKTRASRLSFSKLLELTGKPIYFLFTILVIIFISYLHLLKLFVQNLRRLPPLFYAKLKRFRVPRLHFPRLSTSSTLVSEKFLQMLRCLGGSLPTPRFHLSFHLFLLVALLSALSYTTYYFVFRDLPSITLLSDSPPALSTKILDRHGTLLYQIYKDQNRSLITLDSLPPHLIQATLAAEDKNFYHHFGIDVTGIARAFYNNLTCALNSAHCSASPQGGSTITQQLIKNTLLSSEKTLTRKLKELVLALRAEQHYTKDEILEMYFNQVPYGGTAYGIEEAARSYFGKSARDVDLAESAFLAGLPVSPTVLSPFGTTPYLAKIRQQQVLESMVNLGMITENTKLSAVNTPLNLNASGNTILAPHFVMYVRALLVSQYGETTVSRGGLTVTTTLDLNLHNLLQTEINAELTKLAHLKVGNGAGLILAPESGEILAMVGSRNFFDTKNDGQVNLTLQPRQPGSSIKPLTYALAFMRGLSPSSTIEDAPICFRQKGSPDYCPKNYDGTFHGTVTLKTALGSSYNIPAIKLLNSLGVANLVELARSLGITTWDDPSRFGLALTLGGGEVTLLDLAQAYSVFATGGTKVPLTPLLSVVDSHNNPLPLYPTTPLPPQTQVIPETVAFQINQSLADNQARSPAFGYNSVLNIKGHSVAVKTGTTNNLRDNWTLGYTPSYLVATWVGNNDNTPMSHVASGITGASPIWSRTMTALLKDTPTSSFTPPSTIVRARASCDKPHYDYFIKGQEPRLDCSQENTGQIL